jgi:hypothetical protein
MMIALRKSESEMNINVYVGVVLGWASIDWCIVFNNVFGEHASDSSVAAVAPMCSSVHNTLRFSTTLFQDDKVCWHVKLKITTAASIVSSDHDNNALVVIVSSALHLFSSFSE